MVKVQRLKTRAGKRNQVYLDASLDESGWSPEALERLLDLSGRLSYEESSYLAKRFGLDISSSYLETLTSPYAQSAQQQVTQLLGQPRPVTANTFTANPNIVRSEGRTMVLQIDGVYVLGRPEAGYCPGLEIKSAVLYPQNRPSERWMLAERCKAEDFLPQLSGLLAQAGIQPEDTLLGLGDGAVWIDNIFEHLDAKRITDVYHAVEYLDTVMQALDWDEATRAYHRKQWCKGKVNARAWLTEHLPTPELWLTWEGEAATAHHYLETRLDSMAYCDFQAKGFPIGSGQVEAMNKNVIGQRLKRSGMHWSEPGAAAMASLRAQLCAKHPLVHFDDTRFRAFSLSS